MEPNIRVKGFDGDWEERTLGDIYTERNERGNDSLQILSVSIHDGVSDGELDEEGLGKVVRRSEDKSTYKHVYEGDLVFNMMRAWQGAIGVVKTEGMISPAYISAIPNASVYPPFMDYVLRRKEAIDQINNLSYGVTDFRKRLYWDSFVKVKCPLPSVEEQKRITDTLESLDRYILLNQTQCDDLKELKKYMLQKMFPKDGEKVPEIRFAGFEGEWEQRKLGEMTTLITKGTTPKDKTGEGEINFIKVENIDSMTGEIKGCSKVSVEEHEGYLKRSQLLENDILFSIAGTLGRTTVVKKGLLPANTNQALAILRMHDGDISYVVTVLQGRAISDYIRKNPTVGAQPNLSLEQVSNLEIPYPGIEEQKKIGEYFATLDSLITHHQRKHDTLLEFKAYLLQNMFPKEG